MGDSVTPDVAAIDDSSETFSLCGTWKIHPADETGRRTVGDRSLDEGAWADAPVPGHWRHLPGFETATSALYRRWFSTTEDAQTTGRRRWLAIDGLCSQGDIWLDGAYLGDTEGYFVPHVFDITQRLGSGPDHLLAVEANCSMPDGPSRTDILAGGGGNPGGVWGDVRIEETGDVRVMGLTMLVLEADADRAIIRLRATLDSGGTHPATVRTTIRGVDDPSGGSTDRGATTHQQAVILALGSNEIEWHVAVEAPSLWWPHRLGAQPLYDADVEVIVDGEISHSQRRRFGIRTVDMRRAVTVVNGERLYLGGTHLAPSPTGMAELSPQTIRRDLAVAVDAGLDLLRVHGHVAPDPLYREADRLGLLIWQDVPLQLGGGRRGRQRAVVQARQLVTHLGHHPSIAMWSRPPDAHAARGAAPRRQGLAVGSAWREVAGNELGRVGWARSATARAVQDALRDSDPTRVALGDSRQRTRLPLLGEPDLMSGTGPPAAAEAVTTLARYLPRALRFVSGWGPEAVSGPHGQHPGHDPESEAEAARRLIERLRVRKYDPVGGHCLFSLGATPLALVALLDGEERPTPLWQAVRESGRPLLPVADLGDVLIGPGRHPCPVHVVSDLRAPCDDLRLGIHWTAPGCPPQSWDLAVSVGPDTVIRAARPVLQTRDPGPAMLRLILEGPGLQSHRDYRIEVRSVPDSSAGSLVGYRKGRPSP